VMFTATANTALQVMSPDHLRGRVMSMYSIVMGGMTPAGALVSGALAQFWGAPGALATGGAIGLLAVGAVLRWHHATEPAAAPTAGPAPGAVLPHPDAAATCAGGNGGADEGGDG
jgi:MFS family permease